MLDNKLVSVIMPCFNAARTLSNAIDSVLSQQECKLELIIIDDCSTDSTFEIAKAYQIKDRRIKLVKNLRGKGVASARNTGIEISNGHYICFLDSDDYLLPMSIANRVNFLVENNVYIVFGSYYRLLPNGSLIEKTSPSKVSYKDMLKRNCIGNLTAMYDANFFGKVFQKNVGHEDYLMWLSLLKKIDYAYSLGPFPVAVYRVGDQSLSGNKLKAFIWHWNIIRNELHVSLSKALYFQVWYSIYSLFSRLNLKSIGRQL